jgi:outer membrane biosynthesis protein TonB
MPACELSLGELPPSEQAICIWTDGPRKFAIHVAPEIMGGLGTESWMAFKRVPRRGLEIGGILLGRTCSDGDVTTFWIEGFEPIESEHCTGPSYVLSDPDCALLQAALAKHDADCIGLYRSHTRSERPALQDSDSQLFDKCLGGADALFLILGPVAGIAALFLRTQGNLTCVHEIPLASALETIMALRPATRPSHEVNEDRHPDASWENMPPRSRRLRDVVPSADRPQRPIRRPALKPGFASLLKRGMWGFVLASLALAATVSALSYSRRPVPAADQRRPEYLHLTAERAGSTLRIVWDRNSPAIRTATRGVLHVDDGAFHTERGLVPSELKQGSLLYEPKSLEETFRLDVYSAEPNASGQVQVVTLPPPAPVPPVQTPPPFFRPAPAPAAAPPAVVHAPPTPEPLEKREIPTTPSRPEKPAADIPQDIPPPAAWERPRTLPLPERQIASTSDREPLVRVSSEPVASRFGHLVGKIPLLRRLGKASRMEAPVPLYRAQPQVGRMREDQRLTRPVSVDVKVNVAESGAVRRAEVVEYGDPPNWTLAAAALAAARRWTFEPARVEETAVPSDVILRFRFTP